MNSKYPNNNSSFSFYVSGGGSGWKCGLKAFLSLSLSLSIFIIVVFILYVQTNKQNQIKQNKTKQDIIVVKNNDWIEFICLLVGKMLFL